ncbi:MAG: D-alanyl-D-alanine carboxypeptidase family protein [Acidobacteriaceae bacterium]
MPVKNLALVLVAAAGLAIPGRSVDYQYGHVQKKVLGVSTESLVQNKLSSAPEFANVALPPQLTATSAMAFDLDSGTILYTHNFDESVGIASLTKLMTALVASDMIKPQDIVTVQKSDTLVVGNNMGLVPGERITVRDLEKGMLILSANDAAKTLARFSAGTEEKFIELMNQRAAKMGLGSSRFSNPVGLDSLENYSTAHDLSAIVKEFMKHSDLADIVKTKEATVYSLDYKTSHQLRTTNKLLLDNPDVFGIKTGYTSMAKGNLISYVVKDNARVVTIVLGSDNREDDATKLIDWVFATYQW